MGVALLRVVVSEWMWEDAVTLLGRAADVRYAPELWSDPVALGDALAGAQALIVRNQTHVGRALVAAAPDLRVVGRLGSGLDNVDQGALAAHGIELVHAPGANAVATAEFTLMLALAVARRLPAAARAASIGAWTRAEVLAAHPRLREDDPELRDAGVRLMAPDAMLRAADLVTLHLPLQAATHHILGRRELALMKPGAILVNTARGGLVDEAALAEALTEGWIAGAALDVREAEPPRLPDPLAAAPNILLTPHIAGLSAESQRTACLRVAEGVLGALREHRVPELAGR
jgi:(S)-sulfolactate dehydrogenase